MENTSKALLIAAAILIVIILITLGIKVLGSVGNAAEKAEGVGDSISSATKDSTSKLESLLSGLGGSSKLNHSGVIPEGGIYVSKDGTTYNAGEQMPTPQTGDTYTYVDYKYTLNSDGWSVDVTNTSKKTYEDILESVNEKKITSMKQTFEMCYNLEAAPKIPETVTSLYETFYSCRNLKEPPKIPEGVTSLRGTFQNCNSLAKPPKIPNTVTDLTQTFDGCSSLLEPPELPNNVNSLHYTFYGCKSLKKAPVIPKNLTGSIMCAFHGCSSLEGDIEINIAADPLYISYSFFLKNTVKDIKIVGSCSDTLKEQLAATANNGNVTWE